MSDPSSGTHSSGNPSSDDTIQIFISSPGDVAQERVIAERVVERLQGEFARRATLDVIRWEREPLRATEHFQEQITPPAETDISIFILWSRLGTPLPEDKFQKDSGEQYRSGTEWEFENALQAYQETGTPDLVTYRKTKDPEARLSDEEDVEQRLKQKRALESFVEQWFKGEGESFQAAFHAFKSPAEFEQMLETHLRKLIEEHLPERQTERTDTAPEAHWHQGSPFRGLRPFEEEHAPIFFGRTAAVTQIIERLERQAENGTPFVLVHGPSGTGKSSVVKAGVVPTLTRPGVIEGIGHWGEATFRPSDAPEDLTRGLAGALFRAVPELENTGFTEGELADFLRETPGQAASPLRAGLRNAAERVAEEEGLPEPPTARVLLTIDQLEEIFTLGGVDADGRAAFAEAVRVLTESGLVWTVASIRSDFFPRLSDVEALRNLKQGDGNFDLDPPSFAELGRMIRGPVRAAGLQFEEDPDRGVGLGEKLHEAAAEAPEALPLLEFTLEELYRRRTEEGVLTFEAYEELGGLTGAIAERAESVFADLDPGVQTAFDDLMGELVTIEPGGEEAATSRRAALAELTDTVEKEALTDALVEARLLVTGQTDDGTAVANVAHEALLREWPRLKDWIERNRAFLQTRARVQERAARWSEEGRPDDLLLPTGQPLAEARGLLEEREEALGETLRTYVEQSIERAESKERRRRQVIGGAVAAFVLVVAGFGLFSYQQWTAAAEQRDQSLRSQSQYLADEARSETRKGDAMTGMLLSLRALPNDMSNPDRPYVPEARTVLYSALTRNQEVGHAGGTFSGGPVVGPKNEYVATVHADTSVRIYSVPGLKKVASITGHSNKIFQVDFHPRKQIIATASSDSTARIWSVPGGQLIYRLEGHNAKVYWAEFGANGGFLMTGTEEASRVWNPKTGGLRDSLSGTRLGKPFVEFVDELGRRVGGIEGMRAHPTRQQIVIHSGNQIRFWNWSTGEVVKPGNTSGPINPSGRIAPGTGAKSIVFGPDGGKVATISYSDPGVTTDIWISEPGRSSTKLRSIKGRAFAFSPSGRHVLTERDHPIVVTNVKTGEVAAHMGEKGQSIGTAAFSESGNSVVGLGNFQGGLTISAYPSLTENWQKGGERVLGYVSNLTGGSYDIDPVIQTVGNVVLVWSKGDIYTFRHSAPILSRPFGQKKIANYDISQNGEIAARLGDDLLFYDSKTGSKIHDPCGDTWREGREVTFTPRGNLLLTCDRTSVQIYNPELDSTVVNFRHSEVLDHISDGSALLEKDRLITRTIGSNTFSVHLWRIPEGEKIQESTYRFKGIPVTPPITVSQDGRFYAEYDTTTVYGRSFRGAVSDQKDTVVVRRSRDGQKVTKIPITSYPSLIELAASGKRLLAVYGPDVRVHNLGGEIIHKFKTESGLSLKGRLSPDRIQLVSSVGDSLRIDDLKNGRLVRLLQHPGFSRGEEYGKAGFTPKGKYIIASSKGSGQFVAIWDSAGNHMATLQNTEVDPTVKDRFSLKRSLTSFQDTREARAGLLYNYVETKPYVTYSADSSARFSPDASFFVIQSENNILRIWPLFESTQALIDTARAQVTRQLTDAQREQFNLATEK